MRVKLTEICTQKQWKTIPANELLDKGYPVYGANGIIGYYNEYNHENPVVAITCRGATCGTINITVPQSYVTGNAMCLDDTRSDILPEYLYYCLLHYDFNNVISGSAQPQITRQGLEKVEIKYYPIEAQKKMVAILSKTRAVITAHHQQLQKLDELVKARFVEMFGDSEFDTMQWPTKKLSELCAVGSSKRIYQNEQSTEGVPFLRISDLNERIDNVKNAPELFIPINKYEQGTAHRQYDCLTRSDLPSEGPNCVQIAGLGVSDNGSHCLPQDAGRGHGAQSAGTEQRELCSAPAPEICGVVCKSR